MSLFASRRSGKASQDAVLRREGHRDVQASSPSSQDTLAAISELSQLVRNNPDLVEIYLALGNLYRAQGETERAVQIRTSLIVRPGLDPEFKARALFELGRDYKRAGLIGRAQEAFEEAVCLAGEDQTVLLELARLDALSHDFESAARRFGKLGNAVAQAHFLVRQARAALDAGDESQGKKLLHKALKVHPGSLEAWLMRVVHTVEAGNLKKTGTLLQEAFQQVPGDMLFAFLDGVLTQVMPLPQISPHNRYSPELTSTHPVLHALLPLLEQRAQDARDVLCLHYGALLLEACNVDDMARTWLEKALLLRQDFWPARLELMRLGLQRFDPMPGFTDQVEFFIDQASSFKRFVCRVCGLQREQVFCVCPRCQSWHSIGFRFTLQE